MPASRNVFAPVLTALALVVASGALAMRAGGAADDYHPSLNLPRPPLARLSPTLAPAPPRQSRRVILVILDGLRLRDSFGQPTLDSLRRIGVDAAARSHYPTYSRPNHVTLLTGVPPALSGVRNNFYGSTVKLDSLMDRAAAAGLPSAYVADVASGVAHMFLGDFEDIHYTPWPGGLIQSAELTLRRDYPLVVLLPGAIDEAGHAHGADSDEYRDAIEFVDQQLAAILDEIDLEHDTVVVTADHGHTDAGGHGGTEPDVVEVPLVMAGAGIRPGATLGDIELVDVAPTVAALLGLPAPGHGVGETLTDALSVSDSTAAALRAADRARIDSNRAFHQRAIERARPALGSARLRRFGFVAVLVIITIIGLVFARRVGAVHIDWRVLLIAVPAFPLTYYALLELLGQRLSLSAIPDRGEALSQVFDFGMLSTAVYVIAGWVALRGRVVLRDRLAAANAVVFCGTAVAYLPAAVLWAIFATGPHLEVPPSKALVLVPATYVAVAAYAIGVLVLLGLEIVVFFARAIDPRMRLRRLERAAERERRRLEHDE